jgi:class 3 adenylate cyclase
MLEYANPASELVRRGLGINPGEKLPAALLDRIRAMAADPEPAAMEVEAEGRIFTVLVVSVFEFGSINLYGTDITAARQVERTLRENERLLLNILPPSIATRLREGETVIADRFEAMAVLFADVVEFTAWASTAEPTAVVSVLNEVFSLFDRLVDRHGLEKIKTIGDAYMVAGGLDLASPVGLAEVGEVALDMLDALAAYRDGGGHDLHVRIGFHGGPAVAGVIGLKKFIYDVWGDTVNLASRLEASGQSDRIQVTGETARRLAGRFAFEPRGTVELKGKGPVETCFLVGRL